VKLIVNPPFLSRAPIFATKQGEQDNQSKGRPDELAGTAQERGCHGRLASLCVVVAFYAALFAVGFLVIFVPGYICCGC
jgi:hypothetical protein